jgi:hypothetical protein
MLLQSNRNGRHPTNQHKLVIAPSALRLKPEIITVAEMLNVLLVILTAALTTCGTWVITRYTNGLSLERDRSLRDEERDRHAQYLSIRVLCALEPFVIACCDVAEDNGEEDERGYSTTTVELPSIAMPQDVDWKSISTDLLYRILSLPNEIADADKTIDFVSSEIASPPDYEEAFAERQIQYGRLGLAALELADELRRTFNIPPRRDSKWNPARQLRDAIERATRPAESDADAVGAIPEAPIELPPGG